MQPMLLAELVDDLGQRSRRPVPGWPRSTRSSTLLRHLAATRSSPRPGTSSAIRPRVGSASGGRRSARPRRRRRRRARRSRSTTCRARSTASATQPAPGPVRARRDILDRPLRARDRTGGRLPAPAPARRAAPRRARGVMTDAIARAAGRAARRSCGARRCSAATCARPRGSRSPTARTRSPRSGSTCCGRCCRCSRRPPRTLRRRWRRPGRASVEWKLDGARIQVHRAGDDVRVFTRNLNDVTERLPEVVAAVRVVPGAHARARRRSDRRRRRRTAAAVPGHDEPLRPAASRRARHPAQPRSSSTSCASTTTTCSTRRSPTRRDALARDRRRARDPVGRDRRSRRRGRVPRRRARGRATKA